MDPQFGPPLWKTIIGAPEGGSILDPQICTAWAQARSRRGGDKVPARSMWRAPLRERRNMHSVENPSGCVMRSQVACSSSTSSGAAASTPSMRRFCRPGLSFLHCIGPGPLRCATSLFVCVSGTEFNIS